MEYGLSNYWSMDNHVNDTAGGAHLYNGSNVQFVNDRFGNSNSAIRFSDGFYLVPPGVYFNRDFTVSLWIKPIRSFGGGPVFDFGNGYSSDNIRLIAATSPYYNQQLIIYLSIYYSSIEKNLPLVLGQWAHFVFTLSDTVGSLYINGLLIGQKNTMLFPRNIIRTSNYIGKSSGHSNFLWADLDDFRIYNRSMSQAEINFLFLQQVKTGSNNLLGYLRLINLLFKIYNIFFIFV